ncbi:hypothetical protein BP6252_03816 [Coleophoma cylindrospora]|uniref:Uncharacterized protein n=1 Tax=Coleophoma cylindrospora TaxID=1849047 RepID=A0A3D8S9C8_9HELO|nr:hypothetical protein BP6252_03816 [Coleophoma cylindrospora]
MATIDQVRTMLGQTRATITLQIPIDLQLLPRKWNRGNSPRKSNRKHSRSRSPKRKALKRVKASSAQMGTQGKHIAEDGQRPMYLGAALDEILATGRSVQKRRTQSARPLGREAGWAAASSQVSTIDSDDSDDSIPLRKTVEFPLQGGNNRDKNLVDFGAGLGTINHIKAQPAFLARGTANTVALFKYQATSSFTPSRRAQRTFSDKYRIFEGEDGFGVSVGNPLSTKRLSSSNAYIPEALLN